MADEMEAIHDLATSHDYQRVPTGTLTSADPTRKLKGFVHPVGATYRSCTTRDCSDRGGRRGLIRYFAAHAANHSIGDTSHGLRSVSILLCREAQQTREQLGPEAVRHLYAVSTLTEVSRTSSTAAALPTFRSRTGFEVSPENPVCCEALRALAHRWPAGQFVNKLVKSAMARLRSVDSYSRERNLEPNIDALCTILLAGFAERSVELHVRKPPFETEPSEKPKASPLARAQAEVQSWVSSLRHDLVSLSDRQRLLICHLDDTRCRADLLQFLTRTLHQAELEPVHEVIDSSWIDTQLRWSARHALLVPPQ